MPFNKYIENINSIIKWKISPFSMYYDHRSESFYFEFSYSINKREYDLLNDKLLSYNESKNYFLINSKEVENTLPEIFKNSSLKLNKIHFDNEKILHLSSFYKCDFEKFDIKTKLNNFLFDLYLKKPYHFKIKEYQNTINIELNLLFENIFTDYNLPDIFSEDDEHFFIIDNDKNMEKLKNIFSPFIIENISFLKFNNFTTISSISFIIKK